MKHQKKYVSFDTKSVDGINETMQAKFPSGRVISIIYMESVMGYRVFVETQGQCAQEESESIESVKNVLQIAKGDVIRLYGAVDALRRKLITLTQYPCPGVSQVPSSGYCDDCPVVEISSHRGKGPRLHDMCPWTKNFSK